MDDTAAGGGDTTQVPGPAEVFGRYRLLSLVGQGGMGQVWRAHDSQTDRVVALKVLPARSADDEELRERFRRECRAVALLAEPHVIPIHDFGEIDGRLYLNMRLIDSTDLRSVIRREGALAPQRAAAIISQVAGALQSAHDAGLVHRDVKPSNVLLGAKDFAYLIDFGIAHAVDDHSLTKTGDTIGTFAYMAPEAIGAADKTDSRVDVYALACVLFECLTGRPPFSSTTGIQGLIAHHLQTPPPQPSAGGTDVPAGFDAVIAKGMAKDPDDRYQTPSELAAAAGAAAGDSAGQVTTTGGPTAAKRLRRIRLSRKAIGLVAAAVVVVLVAAAGVTMWTMRDDGAGQEQATAAPPPPSESPAPSGPDNPNNLNADQIDLLKHSRVSSYNRASCHPHQVDDVKAAIVCFANSSTGAPPAMFLRFTSLDHLNEFFSSTAQLMSATSCDGDLPGPEGLARNRHGTKVGRRACYLDKTSTEPVWSTIVTRESTLVAAIYYWKGPGGAEGLNNTVYVASTDGGLVADPIDPDFYTPADQELLLRIWGKESGYTLANCRHMDPQNQAKAQLYCPSNPLSRDPNVIMIGWEDSATARNVFDGMQRQFGDGCAGDTTTTSQAWYMHGKNVGRYTCLTETIGTPRAAVYAVNEDKMWAAEYIADGEAYPYPTPKNEQELLDWFEVASG